MKVPSLAGRLYSWAKVDSTKALALPKRAIIHIQNTAPGPPTTIAVATPARLPVPTRLAMDTAKAWNEEMLRLPSLPLSLDRLSVSRRIISGTDRN